MFLDISVPFLMGSGCCLEEKEVSLAGRTQHRGWSVSRGNFALCGGLSWRVYVNTTKPTRKNNSCYHSSSARCLLLLPTPVKTNGWWLLVLSMDVSPTYTRWLLSGLYISWSDQSKGKLQSIRLFELTTNFQSRIFLKTENSVPSEELKDKY